MKTVFYLKYLIVNILAYICFGARNVLKLNTIKIHNVDETIEKLINTNKNLIRYGDGEIAIIRGKSIKFQEYNSGLQKELIEILESQNEDYILCIPDVFTFKSLSQYKPYEKAAWIRETLFSYPIYRKHIKRDDLYNSLVSRLYLPFNDPYEKIKKRFDIIKNVWRSKNVLIVEGIHSRLGIGNDLFDDCSSIKRILCPNKNAYDYIKVIEKEVESFVVENSSFIVIVALGPTAKALVYRLTLNHVKAYDFGHIDIEYEWFLKRVERKTAIQGKEINEVTNNENDFRCKDEKYMEQIITTIGCENEY